MGSEGGAGGDLGLSGKRFIPTGSHVGFSWSRSFLVIKREAPAIGPIWILLVLVDGGDSLNMSMLFFPAIKIADEKIK